MARNGRIYAFFESALRTGTCGHDIFPSIRRTCVAISFSVELILACYAEYACNRVSGIRSVCHKLKHTIDDPVVLGFKHKRIGDFLQVEVRIANEILASTKLRQVKSTKSLQAQQQLLCELFSLFQPISDRSALTGRCRRRRYYDIHRLVKTTKHVGEGWGFSPTQIIEKYRQIPRPNNNGPEIFTFQLPFAPDLSITPSSSTDQLQPDDVEEEEEEEEKEDGEDAEEEEEDAEVYGQFDTQVDICDLFPLLC